MFFFLMLLFLCHFYRQKKARTKMCILLIILLIVAGVIALIVILARHWSLLTLRGSRCCASNRNVFACMLISLYFAQPVFSCQLKEPVVYEIMNHSNMKWVETEWTNSFRIKLQASSRWIFFFDLSRYQAMDNASSYYVVEQNIFVSFFLLSVAKR